MTSYDPNTLRDALLKQAKTGNQAVDAELAHLRQLVDAEQARAQRLTRWTKRVWIAIALLLVLCLVGPFCVYLAAEDRARNLAVQERAAAVAAERAAAVAAQRAATGTRPSLDGNAITSARHPAPSRGVQILAPIAATLFLLGVPALMLCVIVGTILLIMTFVSRRTAGMDEVRVSLASIDAQLRVLAVKKEPGD
jgi:hypothetical protein